MTNKRKAALLIAAVAAMALIAFAIVYSLGDRNSDGSGIYSQCISRAELYYSIGDYENAVLEYRRAVDEDDQSVEAYEGLYNSYIALGDVNSAIDILRTGYGKTGNAHLQELLRALQNGRQEQTEDIEKTASIEPAINYTLLTRIGGSVYRDYGRTAPPVSSLDQPDGSIFVRFSEVPGTMIFRNSARQPGAVSGGKIAETALPEEVQLDDLSYLVGKTPITREELEELGISSLLSRRDPVYGDMLQFVLRGCTVTAACDVNGTIPKGAYSIIVPTNALELAASGGQAGGVPTKGGIIDAQTGLSVEGIQLRFFQEGESSGEPVEETVTDSSGTYEVSLPPGLYTVEASGDGYVTVAFDVRVGEYDSEVEEDFVVTRELAEGEVRIVLEWGAAPTDLDSHLTGSTDSGTDCHVYFVNMTCSNGDGTVAELDLDDTSSYGPETTTIHNINGKYNFAVNNYTPSTGSLSESGATVTVYLPGQSPAHFSLGSDGSVDGDWWYVCTIDHGVLKSYDG